MKEIIVVIMLLIAAMGMGCIDEKYTEEEKESIKNQFASEMNVLIFDMPTEPSISGLSYGFIDNPTVEDCDNWILKAENHLKTANEYKEIVFVDPGGKYDEDKYEEYVSTIGEDIVRVDSYKGAAKVFEEISTRWGRFDELSIEYDYLFYDYKNGKLTWEEFGIEAHELLIEMREIMINIRHNIAGNESGYFEKSDETLEYIKNCDVIIENIEVMIDIVK